ncbi:MAG TPA: hypothetical protein VGQ86_06900 [Candidatus Limnocylindria bacterium]|jgi:hypothetical protein|nr:hypothetical protein [Candidatus Limnocylindria bacterium]
MALRTTTLQAQPQIQIRFWAAIAQRLEALRNRRGEARADREPIPAYAFKDDPSFWLRSL